MNYILVRKQHMPVYISYFDPFSLHPGDIIINPKTHMFTIDGVLWQSIKLFKQ